ncbi:MAG: hypothetical protein KAV82_11570 [Phycisphaerae bacterium]|nr:hypothetical protein [Phycisphaerae bacterium]
MGIEFHCPKCGKQIRAPGTAGGKWGKCPYCKQSVYIPTPSEEIEEIPLAPIDEDAQARERRLEAEARNLTTTLDREEPGKYAGDESPSPGGSVPLPNEAERDVPRLVHEFMSAMARADVGRADTIARQLKSYAGQAKEYVQRMVVDELPPAELSNIPAAVYKGFLRELLKRLK